MTKIRLQNQQSLKYRGMLSGALTILREEGLAGWGKGMTARYFFSPGIPIMYVVYVD